MDARQGRVILHKILNKKILVNPYLAIPRGQAIETLQLVVEISSSLSSSFEQMTFLVMLWSLWPLFFSALRRSLGVSFSTEDLKKVTTMQVISSLPRYIDTICFVPSLAVAYDTDTLKAKVRGFLCFQGCT